MTTAQNKKGFTLIELLVVIAIIGILAGIVLTSLDTARKKGRDARRIADINQLKLALELYYDTNSQYPTPALLPSLVSDGYISRIPTDPQSTASTPIQYSYAALQGASVAICGSFHLGATLESVGHSALLADVDAAAGTICTSGGTDFPGLAATCGAVAGAVDGCYDVKP